MRSHSFNTMTTTLIPAPMGTTTTPNTNAPPSPHLPPGSAATAPGCPGPGTRRSTVGSWTRTWCPWAGHRAPRSVPTASGRPAAPRCRRRAGRGAGSPARTGTGGPPGGGVRRRGERGEFKTAENKMSIQQRNTLLYYRVVAMFALSGNQFIQKLTYIYIYIYHILDSYHWKA